MNANTTIISKYLNNEICINNNYTHDELLTIAGLNSISRTSLIQQIYSTYDFHKAFNSTNYIDVSTINDEHLYKILLSCYTHSTNILHTHAKLSLHDIIKNYYGERIYIFRYNDVLITQYNVIQYCNIQRNYYGWYTDYYQLKIYLSKYYLFDFGEHYNLHVRGAKYCPTKKAITIDRVNFGMNITIYEFEHPIELSKLSKLHKKNYKLFTKLYAKYECK